MPAHPAIKVSGLSKKYRIGPALTFQDSLRETLARYVTRGARPAGEESDIWAIKELTFEVPPGEVLGVIGPNGSGKTTLLKVLSRITEPTAGRAELRGRVASLIELGAGFHGELSGRENIFLYGAVLGLPVREIRKRLDGIVSFSGVERFIDTPVKRYSSGMYVRLAFSVAAQLDPQVLLLDEILSVSDFAFQQKCFAHLRRLSGAGCAVLVVSHRLSMLEQVCHRALVLAQGVRAADAGVNEAIAFYKEMQGRAGARLPRPQGARQG